MLDQALTKLVIDTIIAQEATAGITGTPIKQAFQPTQQGMNSEPTGYLYKIGDHRRGTQLKTEVWDPDTSKMVHTEIQEYETTFQISVLATQDPKTPTAYTASDIVNLIAYILQSQKTIEVLQAANVGIYKIGDVRNPAFVDDRDRHEFNPSFDFTLTHKQIVGSFSGVVDSTQFQIHPV